MDDASLLAWLSLMPGSILFDHFFGVGNPDPVIPMLTLSAFGLLLVTIVTGFAYDMQQRPEAHPALPMSGS